MEYRAYTCTPRGAPGMPRRRRQRRRRRQGLWSAVLFGAMPMLVLLILCLPLPLERGTAQGAADGAGSSAAEAVLPEKALGDSAAETAKGSPSAAVEPAVIPDPLPPEGDSAPAGAYDFSASVPESPPVDNSYFDDAMFIGDSRTEGLILNTGLTNAAAYVYKGLMVDTVFTKPVVNQGGRKLSVMDALESTRFSKVYIMLGINETGWAYSHIFQSKYGDIVDRIREINPDAVIYIQGIMPVSSKVSSTHSYITNEKINEYNLLLRELAEEKQVYYIDTENAAAEEDGSLPPEAASDGIHLVKAYCETWLDYLKTHCAVI